MAEPARSPIGHSLTFPLPHPSPARIADPQRKRYLKPYEIPTPLPEDCLPVVIPDPGPLELEHRHFFRIVRSLLSWVIYFYLRRLIGRYDPAEGGRRLRNFMEELGGTRYPLGIGPRTTEDDDRVRTGRIGGDNQQLCGYPREERPSQCSE